MSSGDANWLHRWIAVSKEQSRRTVSPIDGLPYRECRAQPRKRSRPN